MNAHTSLILGLERINFCEIGCRGFIFGRRGCGARRPRPCHHSHRKCACHHPQSPHSVSVHWRKTLWSCRTATLPNDGENPPTSHKILPFLLQWVNCACCNLTVLTSSWLFLSSTDTHPFWVIIYLGKQEAGNWRRAGEETSQQCRL